MTEIRIPRWWLAVGAENAPAIRELFAQVVDDSPIPGKELADRLDVTPATVSRWANQQNSPPLKTMIEAVEEIRSTLQTLLERADRARMVLEQVHAADENYEAGQPMGKEVAKIEALLQEMPED